MFALKNLKTENLATPIGLDCAEPRFSWQLDCDIPGAVQKTYRITVRREDGALMWESPRVADPSCIWHRYAGAALQPRTRYCWTVKSELTGGERAEAESWFETGLMDGSLGSWHGAKWIGAEERSLYSTAKSIYAVEAEFRMEADCERFGLIFGANDPRLLDQNKNDYRLAGENYLCYELDRAGTLNIYRVGYAPDDRADTPLVSLPLQNTDSGEPLSPDWDKRHTLRIEVPANGAIAYLDGVKIDCVKTERRFSMPGVAGELPPQFMEQPRPLNPWGTSDVTTYPLLCQIGARASGGASAVLRVRDLRAPAAELYRSEPLTLTGDRVLLDPSHGGIPMLRKEFEVKNGLRRARLYATARGIYECRIDGSRVGDAWFEPGAGQYDKLLTYRTYDVTDLLRQGRNAIGFTLASGWWSEAQTFAPTNCNYWGDRMSLLAMLVIEYEDGSVKRVVTDTSWQVRTDGPIRFAGFFYGERYDARRQWLYDGFTQPEFIGEGWSPAAEIPLVDFSAQSGGEGFMSWPVPSDGTPELRGETAPPVHLLRVLPATNRTEPYPGLYLYDMGQNMVGVPRLRLRGRAGETAVIRYAEVLYPALEKYGPLQGTILTANLRDAISTDTYTFASDGEVVYTPSFTFHGYRYLEITGLETPPEPDAVEGLVLSSLQEFTGDFTSSDPLVDRLYRNIGWGQRGNFLSIPTDCPQRNERMGWAGDAQVFCHTAVYNADSYAFYRRWLGHMRDCQLPNGRYADIAPVGGGFGGIEWGSAGLICTYELWQQYGDTQVIAENYYAMTRYLDHLARLGDPGRLGMEAGPLGDWLATDLSTDGPLLWNAVHCYDLQIMSEMAGAIGRSEDAAYYLRQAERYRRIWNDIYVDPDTGRTRNQAGEPCDTQCSYALPLSYGVFRDPEQAGRLLSEAVAREGYTVTTGFIGTGPLCPALCDTGHSADAYRLVRQTNYPSWLYSITQGATTIWERWNSVTDTDGFGENNGMNSFNHYSLGAVGAWLYGYVLGIRRGEKADGFRTFVWHPVLGGLERAEGHYDSLYGRIESGWMRNAMGYRCRLTVPAGCEAEAVLPERARMIEGEGKALGGGRFRLRAGRHVFAV